MKVPTVQLINMPDLRVKFTKKYDEIPPIGVQIWLIAFLLNNAFSVVAVRNFLEHILAGETDDVMKVAARLQDAIEHLASQPMPAKLSDVGKSH